MKRKFTEEARRIEEEEDPEEIVNDTVQANAIEEKTRGTREMEEALLERGWHRENCGISVQSKQDWKDERKEVKDKHTYDFLLFDIIEAQIVFWKHHYKFTDDEEFIEAVIEKGSNYSGSVVNIVETFLWLRDDIEAPLEHKSEQNTIEAFV